MVAVVDGPAEKQDWKLYAGRDYRLRFPVTNPDGTPFVFEPNTKFFWWFGTDKANPKVEKTSDADDIVLENSNQVVVTIKNIDTKTIQPTSSVRIYNHELEMIDPDGNKSTLAVGTVQVFSTFGNTP